jgi:autotransporter translocation and assembly factor TamB
VATTPPAIATPAATTAAANLSGKWTGHYSGAFSGTFTLNWQQSGSSLSGTIIISSVGNQPTDINGTVHGDTIQFGTVGSQAITYTGTVSGNSMSGTWQSGGGGGNWSASKSS